MHKSACVADLYVLSTQTLLLAILLMYLRPVQWLVRLSLDSSASYNIVLMIMVSGNVSFEKCDGVVLMFVKHCSLDKNKDVSKNLI